MFMCQNMWDRIWEILDKIDEIVNKYDQHS